MPYFHLINNHRRNQKDALTQNARVSLLVFKSNEDIAEYYLESKVEKYTISQLDLNTTYFVGFKNAEDKIKDKLKQVKKPVDGNEAVGSSFKVSLVSDDEIRRILELESYSNALLAFMNALQLTIQGGESISAARFAIELGKIVKYTESLIEILSSKNKQIQVIARELCIFDMIIRFLYYFFTSSNINNVTINRKYEVKDAIQFLRNLAVIILNATQANEITHRYLSQYVRVFIMSHYSPSTFFQICDKAQTNTLKDDIVLLLKIFLWDQDYDTLGQLGYYKQNLFTCLSQQSDYSVHYLKVLVHYFSSKCPNLENTLRENFIFEFLTDSAKIAKVFPKITYLESDKDFQFEFERQDYPSVMKLSDAPPEVQRYLAWVFRVINTITTRRSLKFSNMIINYYSEALCENLVNTPNVSASIKNEILKILRNIHFSYQKLPFGAISPKIQLLLEVNKLEKHVGEYQKIIKEAEEALVKGEEHINVDQVKKATSEKVSLEELSLDLLKGEFEKIQNGKFDSLSFSLELMKSLLQAESVLSHESLYIIHHSLATLIDKASQELTRKQGIYYRPFMENAEKIFFVLSQVDDYMGQLAFKEAIHNIKTKVLQVKSASMFPASILSEKHIVAAASSQAVLERDIVQAVLNSMSSEWKSKEKLYYLAGKFTDMYNEERVMKALWKIVEAENTNLTNAAISLIKNKINFESKVTKELFECVLLTEEAEISRFTKLVSNLLNLDRIRRKLSISREFNLNQKETEAAFDEIVQNFEEIFLSIYDYEMHIKEENPNITEEEAKQIFISRFHFSKTKAAQELPFKYKPACIKLSYQKILNILKAHEILIPYLKKLCFKDSFTALPATKVKLGVSLVALIVILFTYKNPNNQRLLASYNEFITSFYKTEVVQASNEVIMLLAELCRDNKKLLKMSDEHLFKPYAYTLVGYLRPFTINSNAANANVSLPITYMRSLSVLISSELPQDMFDPVDIMKDKFLDFYNFMKRDKRLSLTSLIKDKQISNFLSDLRASSQNAEGFPTHIHIDMPVFYTTLKELLESEGAFVLTEIKERALALQRCFTLEQLVPFITNMNIELNFELKKLTLKIIENLYLKSIYRNTNIFPHFNEFLQFTSILFIDVYGYLNHHLPNSDPILQEFQNYEFLSDKNKEYIKTYNELANTNLDEIIFLNFQSIISFREIWKDYIYYILCDLYGKFIVYFKDFMLVKAEKNQGNQSLFDIWLRLILKLREVNKENRSVIDETLKNVIIHSEYSQYKEVICATLEKEVRVKQTLSTEIAKDEKWRLDLEFLLSKHLGQKDIFKPKFIANNLADTVKILFENKSVLRKLINVLRSAEMPLKDTLFVLKLFRRLIESINQTEANREKSIDCWTDVPYNDLKKIHQHQRMLDEFNIVEVLFSLFYRYEGDKIVLKEVILLCIALLFGGNRTVQESFYKQFKEDYKNEVIDQLAFILENALEDFRIAEGRKTKAAHMTTIKYIFDYLIDHPKSQITITGSQVQIPEKLKHELVESYKREVQSKQKHITTSQSNEELEISFLILKFFQNLCEGHYLNFQEFLRDQTLADHSKSSNIPEFLRQTYHTYVKEIKVDNIELGTQILALLAELEQGESQENVNLLLKKTFINDLCFTLNGFNNELDLLSRGFEFNPNHPEFKKIKSKALGILKDLIEKADGDDIHRIAQEINLRSLVYTFKESLLGFHNKIGHYPRKKSLKAEHIWDSDLSSAFMIYFILRHLSFEETTEELKPEIRELFDEAFSDNQGISKVIADKYISGFFKQYTGSIEIMKKKSSRILKIYFPISVVYFYLKQESKDIFADKVDRSNMQTKISGLMEASRELTSQMYDEYNSRHSFLGLNFNSVYEWLRFLTNCLTLTITIFNLFQLQYRDEAINYKDEGSIATQKSINSVQAFISFLLILLWLRAKMMRHLTFMWDDYVNANVKEEGALRQDIIEKLGDNVTPEIGEAVLRLKGPYSEEWQQVQGVVGKKKILRDIIFILQNPYFLWHICYCGICIASSFHPLVTAFQLFDIVIRSDTVNRIALSVSRNANQFLWTLVLLFVTVYIYTFIGFYFLHERYTDDDVGDLCPDAYSCLLASLNFGLRSGGGIADALKKVQYNSDEQGIYLGHVIFDLSFYIMIITLLLNLIFGMIIDAFGELRDEKTRNEDDKLNICFMCGLSRSEYERTANFDKHTFEEHNMWQYIAYIIYLQEKNRAFATDLTDVESYVLDRYNKRDHAWLPVGRSLALETHFAKEEKEKKSETDMFKDEVLEAIQAVTNQNKQLMTRFNEVCGPKIQSEIEKSAKKAALSLKKSEGISTIKTTRTQQIPENKI